MNYKRKTLVVALSLIGSVGYAQLAHADDADDNSLQRVDVIGSHIKRLKDEKSQPVTSVKVDDLTKQGLTTVEQVVNALSSNQSNIGASSSVGAATGGAAFANLRGLGQQYTLILLDGRRVAYHPLDGTAADLNAIPLSAIERVDVLRDGASAIYGTDAVGGVINFVTKKSFTGLSLGGDFMKPERSGGNEKNLEGSYGYGDLNKDRFNIFATASYHKTDAIAASQRSFANAIVGGPNGTRSSSSSYPGNYQVQYPVSDNNPNDNNYFVGPTAPCTGTSFSKGGLCKTYTSQMVGIQPEVEQVSGLVKGTMLLGDDHQLSVMYNITRTKNISLTAPTPTFPDVKLPNGTQGINIAGAQYLSPAFRTIPLGDRETDSVTTNQNLQMNLEGQLLGWDYRTGLNYSTSFSSEDLGQGFVSKDGMINAYESGQISLTTGLPTTPNALQSASVAGRLDDGTYTSEGFDFSVSKEVLKLPAGMMAVALGTEVRHDHLEHNYNYPVSTEALGPGAIYSKSTEGGRTVSALFAEADIPVIQKLDAKLAVRYDHYNDVGGSVNPEVSLKYEFSPQLLFRSSASTGFRAPSLYDMYKPAQQQLTAGYYCDTLKDPANDCNNPNQQYMMTSGNTKLQAEKSSSLSFGLVLQPIKSITASADFWWLMIKDQINNMGSYESSLFTDPNFRGLLSYDAQGNLVGLAQTQNMGNSSYAGVDLDLRWELPKTAAGNFILGLSGTYLNKSDSQMFAGGNYFSNLGQYGNQAQPAFRWQHNLTLNWMRGPWSGVLSENYKSGYTDQNPNGGNSMVRPYSTWNLSGSYAVTKSLTLTAGVRNLFDQLPPYSNQQQTFQANYDPRFTDQVGRAYFLKFNYKM